MKNIIILICIIFCSAKYVVAQDTIIYRHEALVKDTSFFSMMDSVVSHINECVFVKESPFCIFVGKYNNDNIEYYQFTTEPLNVSELWMYETVFPKKVLYPYKYKSCLFIFSFNDCKICTSSNIDTIQIDRSNWVKYLYIRDEDHPEHMLPLRAIEIFDSDTYSLFRRIPCVDVSFKKRIINTLHTKLFL